MIISKTIAWMNVDIEKKKTVEYYYEPSGSGHYVVRHGSLSRHVIPS